jgi:hypothetical protein
VYSSFSEAWWLLLHVSTPPELSTAKAAMEAHLSLSDGTSIQEPSATPGKGLRSVSLKEKLMQRVLGQESAVGEVVRQIQRQEEGSRLGNRPVTMLFIGCPGTGKMHLAKELTRHLNEGVVDPKASLIRLDMSRYSQVDEVYSFIGGQHSPRDQLLQQLKACPTAVVFFDHMDKAHADVWSCLLQAFSDGWLIDGKGDMIDCSHATFILGAHFLPVQSPEQPSRLEPYMQMLQQVFRREDVLAHLDATVLFVPFTREVQQQVLRQALEKTQHSARESDRIGLTWGSDVEGWLLSNCDLRFGARSIHHQVERHVIRKLALGIQEQEVSSGDNVVLRVSDGSISLKVIKPRKPVTPPASTSTPQPASHPVSTPHPVSQRIPVGVHQPMRRPAPFSPESSSISDQMERYLTGSLSPRFASEPAPGFDATGLAPTAPAGFHALAPIQETVNAPAGFHALAPIQETVHIPPHLLGAQQPQMGEQETSLPQSVALEEYLPASVDSVNEECELAAYVDASEYF